jgi:nucleoid-associated protein YgaU
MMPDANLKILAYDTPEGGRTQNQIGEFVVDFNPNTFVITNKIEYKQPDTKGQAGGDPQFEKIPPLEFSIDFTIDGTGILSKGQGPPPKDFVKKQIKHLREVTGSTINGEIHRPNYLALLWGSFYIECVLTNLNISYNLFDPQGVPLRAKITCSFLERIGPGKGGRQSRLESADLTTWITVQEGDTLPLIAWIKYDDPAYYLQLAKINKLRNFRDLRPGTRLVLPPMKDKKNEQR